MKTNGSHLLDIDFEMIKGINIVIKFLKEDFSVDHVKEIVNDELNKNLPIPDVWNQVRRLNADEKYMDTLRDIFIEIVHVVRENHTNSIEWESFKQTKDILHDVMYVLNEHIIIEKTNKLFEKMDNKCQTNIMN